jgi:hypothetical protein
MALFKLLLFFKIDATFHLNSHLFIKQTIMKNTILLIAFFSIILTGCSSNDEEIPQTGEPFARANQLQFFFSNDSNTDLLNLNNNTILPITYENSYISSNFPTIIDPLRYDYQGGTIQYESKLKKYYWNTAITGKQGYINNRIYVGISEKDVDTIDVKFKFTKGAIGSANGYYALIDKLYYNETLIFQEYPNNDMIIDNERNIFIQKKGTKTVITFMK